ncbi:MAG: hypothetical protein EHM23_00325 [Acidobacteria bacterium]|nr:MAG: hypothetical protein EHM23_00325 [Acidobacteriota bacterium]
MERTRKRAHSSLTRLGIGLLILVILAGMRLGAQSLKVGVAKIDISPDKPVAMAGYPHPHTRLSESVHDRLFARATAFINGSHRLVLVSADTTSFLFVSQSIRQSILDAHGLKPEELILAASHTHSAPLLSHEPGWPVPNNYEYTQSLRANLVTVVGQALGSASEAAVGAGHGSSPIGVNRRVPSTDDTGKPVIRLGRNSEAAIERDLLVLKVVKTDGSLLACLFSLATHSRSLNYQNKMISGDIFGLAEQYAEDALGSSSIISAFAGASGDIDPWFVVPSFDPGKNRTAPTVLMGSLLGEELVNVTTAITQSSAAPSLNSIRAVLPVPALAAKNKGSTTRDLAVTAARIGDIGIFAVDCELFNDIGKAIKKQSPFRETFVITNCGEGGYFPTREAHAEGGYEVAISPFAPEAADFLVSQAVKLLNQVRER